MVAGGGEKRAKRSRLSLRLQVIAAMAIVLSPLLIMGAIQAWGEYRVSREIRFHEIQQTAQDHYRQTDAMLIRARIALHMFSIANRQFECADVGHYLNAIDLPRRNAYRFDAEGMVTCAETGQGLVGIPMPQLDWNERMRNGVELIEESGQRGMALGDPSVYMIRRQHDAEGNYTGSIGISLSLEDTVARMSSGQATGVSLSLVVPGGQVVGSGIVAGVPMEWISDAAALERKTYRLTPDQGSPLDVVLLPLSSNGLWLMVGTPAPAQRASVILAVMVPILVYLAALLAASWIADAMVLRWLERIRLRILDMRNASRYARLAPDMSRAPVELQQVAEAFDDLATRVSTHESDLQSALTQMKAAFREVHHRVKNNLQVMLSMLKLQGRGEPLPETQRALRISAHRVAMMAAVHHALLNEGDLDTVEALDLFNAICNQVEEQQGWIESGRRLLPEVSPGPLPADMAVPLGMFVLEAVSLLCPETGEDGEGADTLLNFVRQGDDCHLVLVCENASVGDDEEIDREASLFLSSFARQIGGTVSVDMREDGQIVIELVFDASMDD